MHFLEGRIVDTGVYEHEAWFQEAVAKKFLVYKAGIIDGQCQRCRNTNASFFYTFHCAVCEGLCTYCRKCIRLGRVSSCTQLVTWNGPHYTRAIAHHYNFHGQLTEAQQRAAEQIINSVEQKRGHLLHAVCGAGKTEILFQPIVTALKKGLRVCVATPRTDVVLELFPRFQQAFSETSIQALYGGATVEPIFAQLIIATTHQLLRFEDAFDVMIVDEADAFPYTYDAMLQQAVYKAKTLDAPILFVTATPTKSLLKQMKKEQWGYSFLPRRYHGHTLPVPTMRALRRAAKQIQSGEIPLKLKRWVEERLAQQQPFLLFVPTVELVKQLVPLLKQLDGHIDGVYAEDEARKEKVLALRAQQLKGLVTTTILERGITITNVQVAVICADDAIFDAGALIQISGRVGRHQAYPTGDIILFYDAITFAMDEAIREIKRLNEVRV